MGFSLFKIGSKESPLVPAEVHDLDELDEQFKELERIVKIRQEIEQRLVVSLRLLPGFVSKAREKLHDTIKLLKDFMDNKIMLQSYPSTDLRAAEAEQKREEILGYAARQNHYKELAAIGAAADYGYPDRALKRVLRNLVLAYQLIDTLSSLVRAEEEIVKKDKARTVLMEEVIERYVRSMHDEGIVAWETDSATHNAVRGYAHMLQRIASDDIRELGFKEANEILFDKFKHLIVLLEQAHQDIDSKELGVFLPEFVPVQAQALENVNGLTRQLADFMNGNEQLKNMFVRLEIEDKEMHLHLRPIKQNWVKGFLKRQGLTNTN